MRFVRKVELLNFHYIGKRIITGRLYFTSDCLYRGTGDTPVTGARSVQLGGTPSQNRVHTETGQGVPSLRTSALTKIGYIPLATSIAGHDEAFRTKKESTVMDLQLKQTGRN